MTKQVFIPLGSNKRPIVKGWNKPDYDGVDPATHNGRVAIRADDHVIVDCDNDAALQRWAGHLKSASITTGTRVHKTPRGYHLIYEWTPGSPVGPGTAVLGEGIDVRAGRGSYYLAPSDVAPANEGYYVMRDEKPRPFNPEWLPRKTQDEVLAEIEEVDFIPEGRRETSLVQLAGVLRRQGLSAAAIVKNLTAFVRLSVDPGDDPITADDILRIARSVSRYAPEPDIDEIEVVDEETETEFVKGEPVFLDARKMELPPPPEWWWKPYFPQGRLVMLDGEEGIGKGMLCVWIAKLSSEGSSFPDGTALEPAPVVWFSAEDDPQEDILRRLHASGWSPDEAAPIFFFNPRKERWRYPIDVERLRSVITRVHPRFVILDPGRSFIQPPDPRDGSFNSEAAMRPGLEALQHLAHDTKTTIVFVHHWNKLTNGSTRDKMGGTVAFLQVVRHRVTMAQVGEYRAFSVEKSNLIDRNGNVRSLAIANNDEMDAGYAVMGKWLPDFRNLDEWIDAMRSLEAEVEIEIEVDFDWQEVAISYGYLREGAIAPTVQAMMKDFDIDEETAKRLRKKLRDHGIIGGNKTARWGVLPPDLAEKAAIERGEGL